MWFANRIPGASPLAGIKTFVYTEAKTMGHLYTVRTGWEAERLAHYLLSRFSFVAQPTTIADDVGSDFYCTIFDILDSKPPTVEPRTSFAIQVKSNADKIEVHNKVQYLFHLEIPFFLGIVDQSAAELKIYSAERFPMMTAVYGIPEKLWLRPVEGRDSHPAFEGESAQSGVTLTAITSARSAPLRAGTN
jgi:hypothetical protein